MVKDSTTIKIPLRLKEPRLFKMIRNADESGVSGTGHVLDGVVFKDGKTVVAWLTQTSSIAVYNSFKDFHDIHIGSHPTNKTEIVWKDESRKEEKIS